jgi:2-oxoglutarate ferredoxin oxidoreductase subunit beta
VVEALVNCVIFNDKTHAQFAADKATRAENTIVLKHGEKMIFGANRDKGLVMDAGSLKVVKIGENGVSEADILVHDAHRADPTLHFLLAGMSWPQFPVALGVIRQVEAPAYDAEVERQVEEIRADAKIKNVDGLLNHGSTWKV